MGDPVDASATVPKSLSNVIYYLQLQPERINQECPIEVAPLLGLNIISKDTWRSFKSSYCVVIHCGDITVCLLGGNV